MPAAVSFRQVSRHFGQVRAVDGVDLEVVPGEFFAMLGPSGSGKTTCLRLIAGFERPTAGHIEIFGERADGGGADVIDACGVVRGWLAHANAATETELRTLWGGFAALRRPWPE